MFSITDGQRDVFWQWDTGQFIAVNLAEGQSISELHITNGKRICSVQPENNKVLVPDELLQVAGSIEVFGYIHTETGGYTFAKKIFAICSKPKPENYVFSPTNKMLWDDIVAAEEVRIIAELDRRGNETDRQTAESERATAEAERERAEESRATAEGSRASAETERETAEESRVSAETERETAEESRVSSETERETAEESRASAEQQRINNENTRVSNENTRIENENERIEAEQERETAEESRATAEENRGTAEQQRATAEGNRVSAESTRDTNEQDRVTAESARVTAENARDAAEQQRIANDLIRLSTIKNTASGNFITVDDAADGALYNLNLYGESVQDGTPTPEAPVDIVNTVAPVIDIRGKNLWGGAITNTYKQFVDYELGDNFIKVTSNNAETIEWRNCIFRKSVNIPAGTQLRVNYDTEIIGSGSVKAYAVFHHSDGTTIRVGNLTTDPKTATKDTVAIELDLFANIESTPIPVGNGVIYKNIQIEVGDVATPYEPFKNKTATLTGVTLRSAGSAKDKLIKDIDGFWKIERNVDVVDLGTLTWSFGIYQNKGRFWSTSITNIVNNSFLTDSLNLLSSNGYIGSGVPIGSNQTDHAIGTYNKNLYVRDDTYTNATAFQAAMEGIIVHYPLATPTYETLPDTIQAELNALQSYKYITNISNDKLCDMDVEYMADTKAYIDKKYNELAVAIAAL